MSGTGEKLYCPSCLGRLSPNNDCWTMCEYEITDEYPPLSEESMLERMIFSLQFKRVHKAVQLNGIEKRLKAFEVQLVNLKAQ